MSRRIASVLLAILALVGIGATTSNLVVLSASEHALFAPVVHYPYEPRGAHVRPYVLVRS